MQRFTDKQLLMMKMTNIFAQSRKRCFPETIVLKELTFRNSCVGNGTEKTSMALCI